ARLYEAQKPEDAYKLYDELAKGAPGTRLAMDATLRQEELLKARPELAKLKEAMAPPSPLQTSPGVVPVLTNLPRMVTSAVPSTPRPAGTSPPAQIKLSPSPTPTPGK